MTILRNDTSFPGTDGSAFPAAFTASHTTGGIDDIEANGLAHRSGTVGSFSDFNRAILNDTNVNGVADLDVYVEWSWGNYSPLQDQGFELFLRASNDWNWGDNPSTGVGFSIDTAGRTAIRHRLTDGTRITDSDGPSGTGPSTTGIANWMRAQVQGDVFRVKWWINNVDEPGTWTQTATQSTSKVTAGGRLQWRTIGGGPAGIQVFTRIWKLQVNDFSTPPAPPPPTSSTFHYPPPHRRSRRR